MPVLGSWVSPGDSVLGLCVEECICDAETVVAAEFPWALPIFVHPSCAELTQTGRPRVVIGTNSSVEIA